MKNFDRYRLIWSLPHEANYPWHADGRKIYGEEGDHLGTFNDPRVAVFVQDVVNALLTNRPYIYPSPANDNEPPDDAGGSA